MPSDEDYSNALVSPITRPPEKKDKEDPCSSCRPPKEAAARLRGILEAFQCDVQCFFNSKLPKDCSCPEEEVSCDGEGQGGDQGEKAPRSCKCKQADNDVTKKLHGTNWALVLKREDVKLTCARACYGGENCLCVGKESEKFSELINMSATMTRMVDALAWNEFGEYQVVYAHPTTSNGGPGDKEADIRLEKNKEVVLVEISDTVADKKNPNGKFTKDLAALFKVPTEPDESVRRFVVCSPEMCGWVCGRHGNNGCVINFDVGGVKVPARVEGGKKSEQRTSDDKGCESRETKKGDSATAIFEVKVKEDWSEHAANSLGHILRASELVGEAKNGVAAKDDGKEKTPEESALEHLCTAVDNLGSEDSTGAREALCTAIENLGNEDNNLTNKCKALCTDIKSTKAANSDLNARQDALKKVLSALEGQISIELVLPPPRHN